LNLVIARTTRKKTQWDIRRGTGIHQSKLSLIENGYVIPTDNEKVLIARVLGFQVNEIEWPSSETESDRSGC
jgi:hypothetical protein